MNRKVYGLFFVPRSDLDPCRPARPTSPSGKKGKLPAISINELKFKFHTTLQIPLHFKGEVRRGYKSSIHNEIGG